MKRLLFVLVIAVLLAGLAPGSSAQESVCAVYITGIGCPHCAKVDPLLLEAKLEENPGLVIIEYEIYQQSENAGLLLDYDSVYGTGFGIPLLVFGKGNSIAGDNSIINNIQGIIDKGANPCPLVSGQEEFGEIDLNELPGSPKIWRKDRVLIADGKSGDSEAIISAFLSGDVAEALSGLGYSEKEPVPVPYSGGSLEFENSAKVGGWIIQWNGKSLEPNGQSGNGGNGNGNGGEEVHSELTLAKLISLAAVDAVNPCALAVLTLMLVAILTYNPENKKKVLSAGISFSVAVFIMYLVYGLVIIKLFQVVQALTSIRLMLYSALGVFAVIVGILEIRSYIKNRGCVLCEADSPKRMSRIARRVVSGITGPKGAFVVGLLVTVFLLPCTIGPYIIAGGILSVLELLEILPLLMLYNFIFILPMVAITLVVYWGIAKVEDVEKWKDKNMKYMHLVAGIILLLLGIAMILGWI